MRFLTMVKSVEGGNRMPPPELIEEIEKWAEEATRNGTLVLRGGLYPSAAGVRVRVSGGQVQIHDGPFAEAKEVVGGFAILEAKTREEVVEAARRLMEVNRKYMPGWEGECELRQIWTDDPRTEG